MTVEEKFTPGPWLAEALAYGECSAKVRGANGRLVVGPNGFHETNLSANARLIAAAPEMLKALKDIYEIDVPDAEWSPTLEKCFGLAREILARVKGGGA